MLWPCIQRSKFCTKLHPQSNPLSCKLKKFLWCVHGHGPIHCNARAARAHDIRPDPLLPIIVKLVMFFYLLLTVSTIYKIKRKCVALNYVFKQYLRSEHTRAPPSYDQSQTSCLQCPAKLKLNRNILNLNYTLNCISFIFFCNKNDIVYNIITFILPDYKNVVHMYMHDNMRHWQESLKNCVFQPQNVKAVDWNKNANCFTFPCLKIYFYPPQSWNNN